MAWLTLTIAGTDRTAYLIVGSVSITDELNARNTCSFTLLDPAGSYRPVVGQEVRLTAGATVHFAGTIDEVEARLVLGTSALECAVTCVDYNQLCDRRLVARIYESMTAGAILRDVFAQDMAGEGIAAGAYVEDGPTISRAVYVYQTVTEVCNELSELIGYAWWIDYAKQLHFHDRATITAPYSISPGSANWRNMTVRDTRETYRNRQYLRAGQDISASRTEQFAGDGKRKSFTVSLPIARVPTVTVNGVAQTVGIRLVESGRQWYWSKGDKEISQDDAGTPLTTSDTLAVTYQGYYPIVVVAEDGPGIAGRQAVEGGTGIYEDVDSEPSIDGQAAAEERARGALRRWGRIPRIVEWETDTAGLAAGQLISITVPGLSLSGNYLIDRVSAADLPDRMRYRVRALDGETLGGWETFFRRLAQAGRAYVIRENEVLVTLKAFTERVRAGDTLSPSAAAPSPFRVGALVGYSEVTS